MRKKKKKDVTLKPDERVHKKEYKLKKNILKV